MEAVDVREKIGRVMDCTAIVMSYVLIIIKCSIVLFCSIAYGYITVKWLFGLSAVMKFTNTIPFHPLVIVLKAVTFIVVGFIIACTAKKAFEDD